jgi:hypothetical protein
MRIGRISKLFTPWHDSCYKCHTTWAFVKGHATCGYFPLCEKCWSELIPATRLPFYRQVWDEWWEKWAGYPVETWGEIEAAVMAGQ